MNSERLPMADVIRFLSFMAIIIFHTSYALWAPAGLDRIPEPSWWIFPFEWYARALSFSGFSVVLLSFFLFGYKQDIPAKWRKLWLVLLLFFVVWALAGGEFPYIWDIYPFLLVVTALSIATRDWPAPWLVVGGFVITSVPFWMWESHFSLPDWLSGPLFGNCARSDRSGEDWPLLPWVGYPLFALGVGRLARRNSTMLQAMGKWEAVLWLTALSLTQFKLGGYFAGPLGDRFACFIFRQSPATFWSHQLWILFVLRLGWLMPVAHWLKGNPLLRWLGRRPFNRKFIFAYFIHYPFCLAWASLAAAMQISLEPWVFALGIVACVIWLEIAQAILDRLGY